LQPMIDVALAFSYILHRYPEQTFATHSIVREMLSESGQALDDFMKQHGQLELDSNRALQRALVSLPVPIQQSAALDISEKDFQP
ncbi:MAG: hypothetical protein KDD62_16230, partial [Bdellovibrionales bacterium]|nr:hypothetical protein [Bdellovibrionales bacterium]